MTDDPTVQLSMQATLGNSTTKLATTAYLLRCLVTLAVLAVLGGCQALLPAQGRPADEPDVKVALPQGRSEAPPPVLPQPQAAASAPLERQVSLYTGTQQFTRRPPEAGKRAGEPADINLDFNGVSIAEVASVILGDLLAIGYSVDPGVKGNVTLRTAQPVARADLLAILETVLDSQGAVLLKEREGLYRIALRSSVRNHQLDTSGLGSQRQPSPGYGLQVVPLRYISAAEMEKILKPLAAENAFVRVDSTRNLLILSGIRSELANLLGVIDTFDVDWLKGMSVGIFEVRHAEVAAVATALAEVFGTNAEGPMQGMVKIVPVKNLNSLLLITPRRYLLDEAKTWIERLDRAGTTVESQFYVYRVQNGEAAYLAGLLTELFGASQKASAKRSPQVAPRSELRKLTTGPQAPVAEAPQAAAPAASGGLSATVGEVRIVADERNNALIIYATDSDYEKLKAALARLDVPAMQVLVEATIVEVTLTDNLKYGLQWFFKNGLDRYKATGLLDLDGTGGLSGEIPGFSYTLTDAADMVRGVLNAFAKDSRLRVISSPSVLVLDNRTAEIRVGNQQPVQTGTTTTDGGSQTTTVQYKDTGVTLAVTPRVNANGQINLEIDQEVTDIGTIDSATGQRSFLQRRIKSSVAVNSGETIILGGLILDNSTQSNSGLPILHELPLVGPLFGGVDNSATRTELLVLISPRAIREKADADAALAEMRTRMQGLSPILDAAPIGGQERPATELVPQL